MCSYRIIKGAEVRDISSQILPLKYSNSTGELFRFNVGENEAPDEDAGRQAQVLEQVEETLNIARASADEIVRQAQLESEQIKEEAKQQARLEGERIKQEAYRDAFEQGRQEGYREGMTKADEEGAAIREQSLDVLRQAEEIRRRTLESLEQDIINLAREIAERLLSAQLSLDPESVFNIAVESLHLVADRHYVVLYINPVELELYIKRKEELQGLLPARAELQVIADASVQPGGCRVETEHGRVDATLETRREALLKALYST
ncbi:MAG: Yop proteins translocation protein L [Pelotomaculum sp. PtaU1.Bin035]|nr:MAG: Yop proteins translocation protein L [Pelotomaculum sp. PtaU1.Bin035]